MRRIKVPSKGCAAAVLALGLAALRVGALVAAPPVFGALESITPPYSLNVAAAAALREIGAGGAEFGRRDCDCGCGAHGDLHLHSFQNFLASLILLAEVPTSDAGSHP